MLQPKQNEQIIKISNWLAPRLDKYESMLALVFMAVLILKISTDLPVDVFLTLALITLAILYFFRSYTVPDDPNAGGMEVFIDKLASISLSVCVMGILFKLENWHGYEIFLPLGLIILVIVSLGILILQSKNPDLKMYTLRLKLRIAVIVAVGLLLYFTPVADLIKTGILKQ